MKKYFLYFILISVAVFFGSRFSNASKPSDFGLKEGDLISAIFSDDPDVYIVNEHGYKRLFLNPEIFQFYSHLGGFANIKLVTPEIRDSFPTVGFFRNCEDNDQKVFGTSVEGEDTGRLHWINKSGDQAVQEDPDFFKKVFCINRKEFNWYPRGSEYKELKEVPRYHRTEEATQYIICHRPTIEVSETIRVAEEALDAHFQHGDTKGACPTYVLPTFTPKPVPTEVPVLTQTPKPIYSPLNLKIISPNGGENWSIGNKYEVTWEHPESIPGVKIELYKGGVYLSGLGGIGGGLYNRLEPFSSWTWDTIDTPNFTSGSDFKMRIISDYSSRDGVNTGPTTYDESDSYFTVSGPNYPVTCDGLKSNPTYTKYYNSCSSGGYGYICFNKYYGTYQGCGKEANVGCTVSNTNASQNMSCSVSGSPVPTPTPMPTPTSTSTPKPTSSATPIPVQDVAYNVDLAIVDIIPSPSVPEAGKDFTVDVVIKNLGPKAISKPSITLTINNSSGQKIYDPVTGYNDTLNSGSSGTVKFYSDMFSPRLLETTLNYPAGTYKMTGSVNNLGYVEGVFYTRDFNSSNDTFSKALEIKSSAVFSTTPTPTPVSTNSPQATPTPTSVVGSTVTLTSPNGGECMAGIFPITWNSSLGSEVANWRLMYTFDDSAWWYVMYIHNSGARSYNWASGDVVNRTDLNSDNLKIRVQAYGPTFPGGDLLGFDISDKVFSAHSTCPGGTVPLPPGNLTATPKTYSNGTQSIVLNWTDNSNDELGFAAYKRVQGTSKWDSPVYTAGTAMEYQGLQSGTTYEFKVRSGNKYGYSSEVTVTAVAGTTAARDLYFGSTGNDVKQLQALLVNEVGYSANLITGYFGRITQDAVKRLQDKYGVKPISGYFGAITRRALDALIAIAKVDNPKSQGQEQNQGQGQGQNQQNQNQGQEQNVTPTSVPAPTIIPSQPESSLTPTPAIQPEGLKKDSTPSPKPTPRVATPAFTPQPISSPVYVPTPIVKPSPQLTIASKKGSSGENVKELQAFLKQLPDVYPQGLVTGFFGSMTENAIKKLQAKFGLETTGILDTRTNERVMALSSAINRKRPPKISNISPAEISVNTKVTLTGAGFTLENNSLFIRGKTILNNLTSHDGTEIIFAIPPDIPCDIGRACPVKIVNSNGISNAKVFKLAEVVSVPPEELPSVTPLPPTPTPVSTNSPQATPTPTPVPVPILTNISPSIITTGSQATLDGSGFTATSNTVIFTGAFTDPNQVITNVSSFDGATIKVTIPSTIPCKVTTQCSVFVTNKNGQSNSLLFWLGQHVDPVTVTSPNGGEKVVQGAGIAISANGGKSEAFGGTVSLGFYLTEPMAITASDPTDLIIGTIPSGVSGYIWDGRKVCEGLVCWDVAPGDYKILAVGPDILNKSTIWDTAANTSGNIDVSDASFTILPTPSITVVSPNGGETYKYGNTVTVAWETKSIASKLVNIKLLKAGTAVLTIASNVAQSLDNGIFTYNWTIPSYLTPALDYTIEVSDTKNSAIKDTSDGQFRISNLASLQIYGPNGGENVMRGFSALLFWTYSGYYPTSINVNLYKGGTFYKTLATGVAPVGFNGATFLKASYPYNSRYAEVPIPLDIPDGNDYMLEIVDGTDLAIRDKSDGMFNIISLPSSVTFKGRMVDALSNDPIPNVSFSTWSGSSWLSAFITGANGEFSYLADTSSLIDPTVLYKSYFHGVPQCNDATGLYLMRYPDFPRTTFSGWYGGLYPLTSVRRQYLPVTSSVMDFGDVPMWPSADFIHTFSDIPSGFYVYYTQGGGGMGNINYTIQHGLQNTPPLDTDVYVQYKDKAGNLYNSPNTRFTSDSRCQIAVQSFMNSTYQWEPYPIGITVNWTGGATNWSVGQPYKITLKTANLGSYYGYSAGVAPYLWEMAFGSLPPGLSLNSATGEITGTPTVIGTYVFGVKIRDANSVRASHDMSITIK